MIWKDPRLIRHQADLKVGLTDELPDPDQSVSLQRGPCHVHPFNRSLPESEPEGVLLPSPSELNLLCNPFVLGRQSSVIPGTLNSSFFHDGMKKLLAVSFLLFDLCSI